MSIEEFAKKNQVPMLTKDSIFPDYYATHTLMNEKTLSEEFLLCSDLLKQKQFASKIDEYLDTTKYVFFALGKGYLKTKNSIGLIYDPFKLVKIPGANLVMQDLLYELDKTTILQDFCQNNRKKIEEIIDSSDADKLFKLIEAGKSLFPGAEYPVACCGDESPLETDSKFDLSGRNTPSALSRGSLLIFNNDQECEIAEMFEELLEKLPPEIVDTLKDEIVSKITKKYTITSNLQSKIKEVFKSNKQFLNLFFNETTEEKMFEIRVPDKHEIKNCLIAVYKS